MTPPSKIKPTATLWPDASRSPSENADHLRAGMIRPATPLPWRVASNISDTRVAGADGIGVANTGGVSPRREDHAECGANAAYIVAAANAYPRLVEALKALVEAEEIYGDQESVALNEVWLPAAALLRDLGEL